MVSFLIVGGVGLGVLVVLVVVTALKMLVSKMISDELRARVDDLPAAFVTLALRLLPPEMREYYRPDWEGNLLVAFNDETSRYPIMRFFGSFRFGFSLMVGARQIRRETKLLRETARDDERQERLAQPMLKTIDLGTLVPAGADRTAWISKALCRATDVEAFFVPHDAQRKAVAICRRCPVITQCGAEALDNRVDLGVWGGMTERQRQTLLKQHPEVVSWAEFFTDRV
jgi:WhiB family transcriptional regulator, redox-sensing transcriptional regulator